MMKAAEGTADAGKWQAERRPGPGANVKPSRDRTPKPAAPGPPA